MAPTKQKEYIIAGKRYLITRYYHGEKDLNEQILDLAVTRAKREMGL